MSIQVHLKERRSDDGPDQLVRGGSVRQARRSLAAETAPGEVAGSSDLGIASIRRLETDFAHLVGPALQAPGLPTGAVPAELWNRALLDPVREMLGRPGKQFRRRVVEAAWCLSGGHGQAPEELGMAIEVIHVGSMIVDDVEDGSTERRGGSSLHRMVGVPIALNAGNFLYFWPLELIGRLGFSGDVEATLRRVMVAAMTRCHIGQALDLAASVGEVAAVDLPAVVARTTDLKTGTLVQLAAEVGAIAAGADDGRRARLAGFGRRLGVGLQMLDDLGNLASRRVSGKRHEDLRLGRSTWPWAWAAESSEPSVFAGLQARARAVQRAAARVAPGAPVPGLDELAQDLLAAVPSERAGFVSGFLAEALRDLESVLGRSVVTQAIAAEIARLEGSY